ncbi:unnamed protein product, partial [Rotaria sp. Silwood1]
HRPISHGQQTIPERPQSQKIVGSSLPHRSAYLHATGEAIYVGGLTKIQKMSTLAKVRWGIKGLYYSDKILSSLTKSNIF